MRVVALAAIAFVLAAQDSASAAECGKGMMWPYVRNPGDCLTPEEIKAGQQGVFSGQLNTNPDVANLKVETPAQVNTGAGIGDSLLGMFDFIPSTSGDDAVYDSLGPAGLIRRTQTNEVSCNKGVFWPFYRSAGDCLTETEKRAQGNTVFRADQAPAAIPASATQTAGASPAATPAVATPAAATTCRRSAFWPFVREVGDCQTEQEKADAAARANKQ